MSESGPEQQATGNRQQAAGDLQKGANIAQRLLLLAAGVIRATRTFSKSPTDKHVTLQVIRAVTSVGANYEEARAAESRADFAHKMGVAAKEIRETMFWLRLIREAAMGTHRIDPLLREAFELAAILRASIRTVRRQQ